MISFVQIFTWIGINPAAARNALIADFLSVRLECLKDMSSEYPEDTFLSWTKRSDGPFLLSLSPLQKNPLWKLVLLVKDV